MTKLGKRVFAGCVLVQNIDFYGTVTEVGEACFQNCSSLVNVHLASELGILPEDTFGGCKKLQKFSEKNKIEGWTGIRCFKDCNSLTYLELPDNYRIGHSYFDTSLFVERNAGINCDEEGYLITYIKSKSPDLIAYPAKMQWNRVFVFVNGTKFIYVAHKGKWIKISGYDEGDIPVSHENVYLWIKLIEQGESNGSPVFVKYKNKWMQVEY